MISGLLAKIVEIINESSQMSFQTSELLADRYNKLIERSVVLQVLPERSLNHVQHPIHSCNNSNDGLAELPHKHEVVNVPVPVEFFCEFDRCAGLGMNIFVLRVEVTSDVSPPPTKLSRYDNSCQRHFGSNTRKLRPVVRSLLALVELPVLNDLVDDGACKSYNGEQCLRPGCSRRPPVKRLAYSRRAVDSIGNADFNHGRSLALVEAQA